jgi:thymidylate synthase
VGTIFRASTGQRVYRDVIQRILKEGQQRLTRGLPTLDLGFTVIELDSPHHALPLSCGRNVSKNVAAAEAAQLIGGFHYPELLIKAAPNTKDYMDEGRFHGSYGQRIGYQMLHVVRKLRDDPGTRQAVVTLWDPFLDNQEGKHDYPCTVMLQFEREGDVLHMNVVMRSNDAWLGLPYDMFQFTQLQLTLCNSLDLAAGMYRHTALSMHLYARNVADADKVQDPTDFSTQPMGIGKRNMSMTEIMRRTRALTFVGGEPYTDETNSERWYRDRFATYMG